VCNGTISRNFFAYKYKITPKRNFFTISEDEKDLEDIFAGG
jgi:hypothetical protein